MGGCYSYESESSCVREPAEPVWMDHLKRALRNNNRLELTQAYKGFFQQKNSGFISEVAKIKGINKVADIPKEFPEWEYEFKFDVGLDGRGKEPDLESYLDAFDFPVARNARFFKDPVNQIATGINRFHGQGEDERLVVITKGNGIYLKEKGKVEPIKLGIPYEHLVVKRLEKRYSADVEQVADKMTEAQRDGSVYLGRIRKEKGDVFIMDANDGRIYGFTMTRAHLIKAGEEKESSIQRQLEIEYAGYIPGFEFFQKDSEKQVISGMIDLARYTYNMYMQTPLTKDLSFNLMATTERKYDFVSGKEIAAEERKRFKGKNERLVLNTGIN